jgi:hypothetical protein
MGTSNDLEKRSGSFDLSQASFDTQLNQPKISYLNSNPSRRYSGGYSNSTKPQIYNFLKKNANVVHQVRDIKLPIIKEKKKDKDDFKDLLQLMKVRKRGVGGVYQEKGASTDKVLLGKRHSFDLRKIE